MGKPGNSKRIGGATNNISASASAPQPQPTPMPQPTPQPQQPQQQPNQNQQPQQPQIHQVSVNDLTSLQQFANLDDRAMAKAIYDSGNTMLPVFLRDQPSATQNLVFAQGWNEAPLVLNNPAWNAYLAQNNIPKSQVMFRSSNPASYFDIPLQMQIDLTDAETADLLRYGQYSYIGGKYGGQALGAGSYFSMRATGRSIYGSATMKAVLSPNANIIDENALRTQTNMFNSKMPLTSSEIRRAANRFYSPKSWTGSSGEQSSLYALALGYNVVRASDHDYHNIILRNAIVMNKWNF